MSPRWEPDPGIRRGRSVVRTLHAHLVFTPKYRRGPFTDNIRKRCEEVMRDTCYLWGEHFWSPSHFAASCGGAPLAVVKEYIAHQKRPE
ncbi:transposase [Streptomyces echinatus]|uniref:Putative transposase n=1 Tax=Streptomyces echinatus TaxID=67293 RepID=A0A7W9UV89_9ACTN|nr:putative transposase [Streptomyces echinatus]